MQAKLHQRGQNEQERQQGAAQQWRRRQQQQCREREREQQQQQDQGCPEEARRDGAHGAATDGRIDDNDNRREAAVIRKGKI